MVKNNIPKTRGIALKAPEDVRRVASRIVSECFKDQTQIENAGKINNLLVTWLKAWELEKVSDLEARIKALENERAGEKK
jgi:hypothetical protein